MIRVGKIRSFVAGLCLLGGAAPGDAFAGMTCDEIMNLVNLNVPSNVVIDTIKSSGSVFSEADIACLVSKRAPSDVLAQAKAMMAKAAPKPTTTSEDEDDLPDGDRFDSTESLGRDAGGDDSEDVNVSDCADLERHIADHKANRHQSASEGLFELLEENSCPSKDTTIKYYLAKSLHEMQMYHSAQHYYMEVVRAGPQNPLFRHALPRLAAIAEYTGNDYELLRIVGKIAPDAYPRQSRPLLHYLMGRKSYENGDLSAAASHFDQVPTENALYPRAQYFVGIINYERDKLKSAAKSFREVIKAEPEVDDPIVAKELEDLKDLSLINIGRIYFGLKRLSDADQYYQKVQRDSMYWPESLFERSWVSFYQGDYNEALGLLLTVDSPYFSDVEFVPETSYLRAVTYFTYCEYKEVERLTTLFKSKYQPIRAEMKSFIERYRSEEDRKFADRAYDTYFGEGATSSKLPKSLFTRILRNRDLSSLVRHMDMMNEEVALIDTQKGSFKSGVGDHLKKVIESDRQRYKDRAGKALLQEMLEQYRMVDGLLSDIDVLEFEVADAQRADYMFQMNNPDVSASDKKPIDFATSSEIIYWPFNGEFWADELSYYRYTEQGACEKK
jgi:tetratricopeptide (TPR) repeat protein